MSIFVLLSKVIKINKTYLRAKPIFSDTSRFKKNEQVLQRSRQEFIGLFKNSPEALAYTDMDGNISYYDNQVDHYKNCSHEQC